MKIFFPREYGWRERLTKYTAEGWRVYGPGGKIVYDVHPAKRWGKGPVMRWSIELAHMEAKQMADDLNAGGLRRERALRQAGA